MQTRKKSISLHALGVIPAVPRGSAHRSTSSSSNPSNATTNPSADAPPAKRLKRSHTLSSTSDSPASPTSPQRRRNVSASIDKQRPLPAPQTTPPPSPRHHPNGTLDYSGIGDDIVVGVLRQLEVTGNRPHQIKELATALTGSIRSVDSSSNPVAIISSRLTNYLRRPWTALAPCPLAKEQVNVHPRRVYYFLTTAPRQEIPDYIDVPMKSPARIISPSISSGAEEDRSANHEPLEDRKRDAHSPSPELDELDLPELDNGAMSGVSFGAEPSNSSAYMDSRRAASPPLEHDEREFTQTATSMANRAQQSASASTESLVKEESADNYSLSADSPIEMDHSAEPESEELMAQRNHEAAAALFGQGTDSSRLGVNHHPVFGSSPMLHPSTGKDLPHKSPSGRRFEDLNMTTSFGNEFDSWGDLKSPEAVGLNELDDMLGGY